MALPPDRAHFACLVAVALAVAATPLPLGCTTLIGLPDLPPLDGAGGHPDELPTTAGSVSNPSGGQAAGGSANPGDDDPCLGVLCNTPPASFCKDDGHLQAYDTIGSCSGGTCTYKSQLAACTCKDDACTTDPCVSITCNTPPLGSCVSLSTERSYEATGTCSNASCSYEPKEKACLSNTQCRGGSCTLCFSNTSCGPSCTPCNDGMMCKRTGASTQCGDCTSDTDCGLGMVCNAATNRCECNAAESPRCLGNTVQTCDANGQWSDSKACSWPTPACALATCVAPPSCDGLPTTCGPAPGESCCASLPVDGGTFFRGYDGVTPEFMSKAYPATLSDYRLDKYEVTVGRFRKFVSSGQGTQANPLQEGAGAHPLIPSSGWRAYYNDRLPPAGGYPAALKCDDQYRAETWTDAAGANENRPIDCLDWYQAFAFCIWDGGFLPTEIEWSYAASGGDQQRVYAWPNVGGVGVIDCEHADTAECEAADGKPIAVGSHLPKGAGRWGHAGLNGGVLEWNLDQAADYTNPCTDCATLQGDGGRLRRGGAFNLLASYALSARRESTNAESSASFHGVRCARLH
jgi:sulfatase modifying factor 1